ncbi:MAG: ABC transporter ATP-binding protein [Nitrospira sp.]|jgi:lipopolysaccharide transport system ATP-binding protein|nr:ABC transporter ATP-binding protein [Nitrospira sp.]MBP6604887.1 ABC transporter ATP-binding protein [Nitrospira sp.]HQY58033.1 ABC transporter ATP-binding protein [Nitrospira sp.]HRA96944.1 ABC transporter ATP-binding protein [Nitrospira sp.]
MSDTAVSVTGLSKRYRLGTTHAQDGSLAGALARGLRHLAGRRPAPPQSNDTLWALRDVSFEIKKGEVFGVIGTNGSGKSTLLKILSRVTEPTKGRAIINGRFCGLLEVGTGFHPELTGRDNVFMSGAILGMKRQEIAKKFDEIVAFAEVEQFIDTPVKHYSSGMYVRLGFSVLAHMDPDILIVDEVLAVGDVRFQKKCMGKMEDVGHHGRTVILVSHDMPAITRMCSRAILLNKGEVVQAGPAHDVVNHYLHAGHIQPAVEWPDPTQAPANDVVRLRAVRVRTEAGIVTDRFDIRKPIDLEVEFDVVKPGHIFVPVFNLYNEEDVLVFIAHDRDPAWQRTPRPTGRYTSTARMPGNLLAEGMVAVSSLMMTEDPFRLHVHAPRAIGFRVDDSGDGDSARGDFHGRWPGVVRPLLEWRTRYIPE